MTAIIYILGIVTGLLIFFLLIVIDIFLRRSVNTTGLQGIIKKSTQQKAEIIEPKNEEFESFINSLKTTHEPHID